MLYLQRGRTREILDKFDDPEKVRVVSMSLQSTPSLEYNTEFQVGVLKVKTTNNPVGYFTPQTLNRHQCEDLMRNYDLYADEILQKTGENLLDDERVYIISIDLLDKAHNNTARFRVLKKVEREYTEHYRKIIKGDRATFTTSLEFDNALRKQIYDRSGKKATQRVRETIKPINQTSVYLQSKIPYIYEKVDRRIVAIYSEPYLKLKERSDRYEFANGRKIVV